MKLIGVKRCPLEQTWAFDPHPDLAKRHGNFDIHRPVKSQSGFRIVSNTSDRLLTSQSISSPFVGKRLRDSRSVIPVCVKDRRQNSSFLKLMKGCKF